MLLETSGASPNDSIIFDHNNPEAVPSNQQVAYLITECRKEALVTDIVRREDAESIMIYVRTNFAADHLAQQLNRSGITAESLHDNKSRRTSEKSFSNFRRRNTRILVATESAASRLDASEVSIVINYDVPLSADTYASRIRVHRRDGYLRKTLSLCSEAEINNLTNINRAMTDKIELVNARTNSENVLCQ